MTKKKSEIVAAQSADIEEKHSSAEALISQAISQNVPVETMERLLIMRRELKAEAAKEAFDTAMAKFQSECPTIVKTREVKTDAGRLAYRYAPIESIVEQVRGALQANGFSYKTDQELKQDGVKITVRVIHAGGHSEETPMEVPFGSQTKVMSQSQVAAAASTFAKRYAFCNAFGILTGDEDTDARPEANMERPAQGQPRNNPASAGAFEVAKRMIDRCTDVGVLNDYAKKVAGSTKYSSEEKETLEGAIAARVGELGEKDIIR